MNYVLRAELDRALDEFRARRKGIAGVGGPTMLEWEVTVYTATLAIRLLVDVFESSGLDRIEVSLERIEKLVQQIYDEQRYRR